MEYPSTQDIHDFTSPSQWDQRIAFPHFVSLHHDPITFAAHHLPSTSAADLSMSTNHNSNNVATRDALGVGDTWTSMKPCPSTLEHITSHQAQQDPSPASSSAGGKAKSTKSHAKKRPDGHIKRPPNAFMLFRAHIYANKRIPDHFAVKDHRDYSRVVAHMWHNLEEAERKKWYEASEKEKEMHKLLHPDYKFAPSAPKKEAKPQRKVAKASNAPDYCEQIADKILKSFGREGVNRQARATPPSRRRKTSTSATDRASTAPALTIPSVLMSASEVAASSASGRSLESSQYQSSSRDSQSVEHTPTPTGTNCSLIDAAASIPLPKNAKTAPRKARSTATKSQPAAKVRQTAGEDSKPTKGTWRTDATSRAKGKAKAASSEMLSSQLVDSPTNDGEVDLEYVTPSLQSLQRRRSYSMSGLYASAVALDADLMSIFEESADAADKTFGRLSLQDQPPVFGEELFAAWSERMAQSTGMAAATNMFADPIRAAMPLARSFSADQNALAEHSAPLSSVNYDDAMNAAARPSTQPSMQPTPSSLSSKKRPERLALLQSNMGSSLPMMSPRSYSVGAPLQSSTRALFASSLSTGQMGSNGLSGPPLAHMQERPRTSHSEARTGWLGNDDGGPTLVSPMRGSFADARRISISSSNQHLWSPPSMLSTADFRSRFAEFPPSSSSRMSFSFPQTPGTARSGTMLRSVMSANDQRRGSYPPPMYCDDFAMADKSDVAQMQPHAAGSHANAMTSPISSREDGNRDRLINDAGSAAYAQRVRAQAANTTHSSPTLLTPEAAGFLSLVPQHEPATGHRSPPFRTSVLETRTASHASHADKRKRKMSIGARYSCHAAANVAAPPASNAARPMLTSHYSSSGKSSST